MDLTGGPLSSSSVTTEVLPMTWNRKAGARTEICIRCGSRPPAAARRRCRECLAEMESDRRERLKVSGDERPCAVAGCDAPRYRVSSQYSSYCYEHHLAIRKKARLKWQYGLSLEQYNELMAKADHRCQVCKSQVRLVVDHCHITGNVRGVLCDDCNQALGRVRDDPEILLMAIHYLMSFRDIATPLVTQIG